MAVFPLKTSKKEKNCEFPNKTYKNDRKHLSDFSRALNKVEWISPFEPNGFQQEVWVEHQSVGTERVSEIEVRVLLDKVYGHRKKINPRFSLRPETKTTT